MNKLAFRLYILFIISFFLHLPKRVDILAVMRFDLIIMMLIFSILILTKKNDANQIQSGKQRNKISISLIVLLVYVLITLPLVRWPGSIMHFGLPNLIKAIIFFYYTVSLLTNEKRLKIFMFVFISCQLIRVIEPLYMNYFHGYWGSQAYMDGEMMDRLSGSESDVINPNGLAFVIVTVLPFLYYANVSSGFLYKVSYLVIVPMLMYALLLTASRTGLVALVAILLGIFIKSKKKTLITIISVLALIIAIPNLSELQRDRYLSLFSSEARGSETAQGRVAGISRDFTVAMQRPMFGHGLGTSLEANTHVSGVYQPAHNLYLEIWQELGLVGLLIFLYFIKEIIKNFIQSLRKVKDKSSHNTYLLNVIHAMQVWLGMNILFSFASYGLSSYEWYLFGGLSVVLLKLSENCNEQSCDTNSNIVGYEKNRN